MNEKGQKKARMLYEIPFFPTTVWSVRQLFCWGDRAQPYTYTVLMHTTYIPKAIYKLYTFFWSETGQGYYIFGIRVYSLVYIYMVGVPTPGPTPMHICDFSVMLYTANTISVVYFTGGRWYIYKCSMCVHCVLGWNAAPRHMREPRAFAYNPERIISVSVPL